MYDKPQLGLSQALAAMSAMLDETSKQPDRPAAIAMVDDRGNLITYARMDNCKVIPQQIAVKKAYTSAVNGVDSEAYAQRLKSRGRIVTEIGDPNLVAMKGGVAILRPGDGAILGGIGVSGLSDQEDEDLARIGLKALNL